MITLHIEHAVTDLATWEHAFHALSDVRKQMGVVSESVRTPVEGGHHLVIDLGFADRAQAERFLAFLRARIWANPANAPALAGTPVVRVLRNLSMP